MSLFTVYGLYAELLARAGQPVPQLSGEAQSRLLRAVVDQLAERGALTYFAPLCDKPGVRLGAALVYDAPTERV